METAQHSGHCIDIIFSYSRLIAKALIAGKGFDNKLQVGPYGL
jgi:hypothetical protein